GPHGQFCAQGFVLVQADHLLRQVIGVVGLKVGERVFAEVIADGLQPRHENGLSADDEFRQFVGKCKVQENVATDGQYTNVAFAQPAGNFRRRHQSDQLDLVANAKVLRQVRKYLPLGAAAKNAQFSSGHLRVHFAE